MSPMDPVESSDSGDHWATSTILVVYNDVYFTSKKKEKLDLM